MRFAVSWGSQSGEMAELADGAALEMLYRGNPVVGWNPTLSATVARIPH